MVDEPNGKKTEEHIGESKGMLLAAVKTVIADFKENSYTAFDAHDQLCKEEVFPAREFYGWCDKGCNTLVEYLVPVRAVRIHFCADLEDSCRDLAGNLLLIEARYSALRAKGYPAGELCKEEFVKKWWVDVFSVQKQTHLETIIRDVVNIMETVKSEGVHRA